MFAVNTNTLAFMASHLIKYQPFKNFVKTKLPRLISLDYTLTTTSVKEAENHDAISATKMSFSVKWRTIEFFKVDI